MLMSARADRLLTRKDDDQGGAFSESIPSLRPSNNVIDQRPNLEATAQPSAPATSALAAAKPTS